MAIIQGRPAAIVAIVVLGDLLAMADACAEDVSFIARRQYPESRPWFVATSDFNGDGMPDLAVTHYSSDYVSVLLGLPGGGFQAAQHISGGTSPVAIVAGDFNGDGVPDLAMANWGSNNVSVLLGNGDGSFQAAWNFGAGIHPYCMTIYDFNMDGVPDLAVTNPESNRLSVLLGRGDGSFEPARDVVVDAPPPMYLACSIAVADFNGDGVPDIVVGDSSTRGDIWLLLGNGDGSFQAAREIAVGGLVYSAEVGDFNGDGLPDLAVTHDRTNISVLLGNGDGSFQAPRRFEVRAGAFSVTVSDLNGDGFLDLSVVNGADGDAGAVSVLLGNGDGSFQAARSFNVSSRPTFAVVGNFHGDCRQDLAIGNSEPYSDGVTVLVGTGDGDFEVAADFSVGPEPVSIAVDDFNGDGLPDVVVTNFGSILYDPGNVSVLLGNGDGSFQAARNFDAGRNPQSVAVGDFDGDGVPDLAVANFSSNDVSVLLGNGDGSFRPARSFAAPSPRSVAVSDFNGDGIPDLAVASYYASSVSVLLGNGDGSFQTAQRFDAGGHPQSVAVGDFNNDGVADLALAVHDERIRGSASVLLGKGDGSFQAPQTFAVENDPRFVTVADLNADGVPDLVVPNGASHTVSVLLGNGDGSFQTARHFISQYAPVSVAVRDFNRDGVPDLAVAGSSVSVLLGIGDGNFRSALYFGGGRRFVAAGDFTCDGLPDLVTVSGAVGDVRSVSVFINNTQ